MKRVTIAELVAEAEQGLKYYDEYTETVIESIRRGFGQIVWNHSGQIKDLLEFHRQEIKADYGVLPDKPDIEALIKEAFERACEEWEY
jgi:hypothetical protein